LSFIHESPPLLSLVSGIARQESIQDRYKHEIDNRLSAGLIKELSAAYLGDTRQALEYHGLFFGGSTPLSKIKSPFLFSQFKLAMSGIIAISILMSPASSGLVQ